MSMSAILNERRARKRGIALVVVLALLAMMVLLAVAFAISMRTERTASRDYLEMVKARQRVHNIATALVIGREDEMTITKNQSEFYRSGYFVSRNVAHGTPCYHFTNSPTETIRDYIPQNVNQQLFTDLTPGTVMWVGTNQNGRLTERHAYVWFDCSDFLDAHVIGTNVVRGSGLYSGDVRVPSEVSGTLQGQRAGRRFESIGEIRRYLGSNRSLVPFSYIPVGQYWDSANNTISNRVFIGTNATQIQSAQTGIKNVANSLGLDASFYDNLYDFANSGDPKPLNANQMGGGKLVPMLYELIVTNGLRQITIGGTKYWDVETRFLVETWFPFPVTDNLTYSISIPQPQITISTVPPSAFPWTEVAGSNRVIAVPNSIATATNSFWTNKLISVYRNADTNILSSATTTIKWSGIISVNTGSSIMDQMPIPTTAQNFTFTATPGSPVVSKGWGVNDPRINWRTSDWVANKAADPIKNNLGRTNDLCNVNTDGYGDGSTFMYAPRRNSPGLRSIGDLGYLLYDASKPWHTVRLMGPNAADPQHTRRLLDRLTIIPTNRIYQGFVNPNSQDTNALMCAFWDALKEKYPGELNAQRISDPEARKIAARLIALGRKSGLANAYTNISDVCRLTTNDLANAFTTARDKDFWVQKSIMRNNIGLLHPRQNLWCAIIFSQSVKCLAADGRFDPIRGDFVAGEAGAIMLVWRDPYETPVNPANPNGLKTHKCFIRFFKWL
jgi:hypothetical protein